LHSHDCRRRGHSGFSFRPFADHRRVYGWSAFPGNPDRHAGSHGDAISRQILNSLLTHQPRNSHEVLPPAVVVSDGQYRIGCASGFVPEKRASRKLAEHRQEAQKTARVSRFLGSCDSDLKRRTGREHSSGV